MVFSDVQDGLSPTRAAMLKPLDSKGAFMSEPENIRRFKEMAGRILGALYADHPQSQWDDPSLVFGEIEPSTSDEALYEDTVSYLSENGYLTRKNDGYIRLNDRSYHILGAENPLDPNTSIGATISAWAKDTTNEVGKSVITQAAGTALAALYTTLNTLTGS